LKRHALTGKRADEKARKAVQAADNEMIAWMTDLTLEGKRPTPQETRNKAVELVTKIISDPEGFMKAGDREIAVYGAEIDRMSPRQKAVATVPDDIIPTHMAEKIGTLLEANKIESNKTLRQNLAGAIMVGDKARIVRIIEKASGQKIIIPEVGAAKPAPAAPVAPAPPAPPAPPAAPAPPEPAALKPAPPETPPAKVQLTATDREVAEDQALRIIERLEDRGSVLSEENVASIIAGQEKAVQIAKVQARLDEEAAQITQEATRLDVFAGTGPGQASEGQRARALQENTERRIAREKASAAYRVARAAKVAAAAAKAPPAAKASDTLRQRVKARQEKPVSEEKQIISDEGGDRSRSYRDADGFAGGIGHKLTPAEEALYPSGTEIPQAVRTAWFKTDIAEAIADARNVLPPNGFQSRPWAALWFRWYVEGYKSWQL
jgi:hypothetical protein